MAIKQAERLQRCIDRAQSAGDRLKSAITRVGLEAAAQPLRSFPSAE
jgi:hypothetical protein